MTKQALLEDLQAENQTLRDYAERVHELEKNLKTNSMILEQMMELAGVDLGAGTPLFDAPDSIAPELGASALAKYSGSMSREDSASRNIPNEIPMRGSFSRGFAPDTSEGIRRHLGVDIAAREGAPVYATADGKVEFAGWDDTFGNFLVIDHMNGYTTRYGHNRALLVSVGDMVKKGELVALCGNTGKSSAPHLHYEIRYNGKPINPAELMDIKALKQVD